MRPKFFLPLGHCRAKTHSQGSTRIHTLPSHFLGWQSIRLGWGGSVENLAKWRLYCKYPGDQMAQVRHQSHSSLLYSKTLRHLLSKRWRTTWSYQAYRHPWSWQWICRTCRYRGSWLLQISTIYLLVGLLGRVHEHLPLVQSQIWCRFAFGNWFWFFIILEIEKQAFKGWKILSYYKKGITRCEYSRFYLI